MDLRIALDLCRTFEGYRSKPYLCPASIPTIGYGSTFYADGRAVTLADASIGQAAAEELLETDLRRFAASVMRLCPSTSQDTKVLNALVDFCYNLGAGRLQTSTLRRKVNDADWDGARQQLKKWVRGGGRVLPGLVARREAEAALLPA